MFHHFPEAYHIENFFAYVHKMKNKRKTMGTKMFVDKSYLQQNAHKQKPKDYTNSLKKIWSSNANSKEDEKSI